MTLHVITTPSPCADADAVDLAAPSDAWLAPSADVLDALRFSRRRSSARFRNGGGAWLREAAWTAFERAYASELRAAFTSPSNARSKVVRLLSRSRVVIACADAEVAHPRNVRTVDPTRSPRAVVARVLVELGAVWDGEAMMAISART